MRLAHRTGLAWLSNLAVGSVVVLVLWLSLWPLGLREALERRFGYPSDLWIVQAVGAAPPTDAPARQQALGSLNALLREGRLAVEASAQQQIRASPKLHISQSSFELGLARLTAGRFEDRAGAVLAQSGGPYALGDLTSEGVVTGLAELVWRPIFVTDAYVLQGFQDDLNLLAQAGAPPSTFFVRGGPEDLATVRAAVAGFTGRAAASTPFYDFVAERGDYYALERQQVSLQRLAAAYLFTCALLAIFSAVNRAWWERREVYRTERVLGRTRGYFLRHWLARSLRAWLPGTLLAASAFGLWVALRYQTVAPLLRAIAPLLGMLALGVGTALVFAALSSRVPLARSRADAERGWADALIPGLVTFFAVLGAAQLLAGSLALWLTSSRAAADLGAGRVVAWTTNAARAPLPPTLCEGLPRVRACGGFSLSSVNLWGPNLAPLQDEPGFQQTLTAAPEDMAALRLRLLEGRWPRAGAREAVVAAWALPRIRDLEPDFGLGSALMLEYRIVGVFHAPKPDRFSLFASLYDAPILLAPDAPQMEPSFFLSPLGRSGLLFAPAPNADLSAIAASIRREHRDVELIRPSQYAEGYAQVVATSLRRLGLILLFTAISAGFVYADFTRLLLAKRRETLLIWRMLGLNLRQVRGRVQREMLPLILAAGLVACAVALVAAPPGASWAAIGCGLLATLGLLGLSVVLLRSAVAHLGTRTIAALHREA